MLPSASEKSKPTEVFFLDQPLRQLKADADDIPKIVCRTEDTTEDGQRVDLDKHWDVIARSEVVKLAAEASPGSRFGLVCDAGLGKTFNMRWLFQELGDKKNRHLFGVRVPFLIHLHEGSDLAKLEQEDDEPDSLLNWFARKVVNSEGNDAKDYDRVREELKRKRGAGQLILLLDGLDHALASAHFPTKLATLLNGSPWAQCPVWVSGRPYAFRDTWKKVFDKTDGTFFRVDRFRESEISQYMLKFAEGDWSSTLPKGSQPLLGVPRLLKLICGIIRTAIKKERNRKQVEERERKTPEQVVEELDLKTPADVYYRAFFEPGTFGDEESYGLLAQGNKGKIIIDKINGDFTRYIGLDDREFLTEQNYENCLTRAGEVIGEIAFHLTNANNDSEEPEPNTSGMPLTQLQQVVQKRLSSDQRKKAFTKFNTDADVLTHTNAHHLDFLILAESGKRGWRFENRTVQAFFAAHWVLNHSTSEDRKSLQKWIIDRKGNALDGFDEFWTFAAELLSAPDPKVSRPPEDRVDLARWKETFAPCYTEPAVLTSEDQWKSWLADSGLPSAPPVAPYDWVQWNRRMIYHTLPAMRRRFPRVVEQWRMPFAELLKSNPVMREFMTDDTTDVSNFRRIKAGWCQFGADPDETDSAGNPAPIPGVPKYVEAFLLHRYLVTNEVYELFDPAHFAMRWLMEELHPLADPKKWRKEGGDDRCPVVNVTWYDAYCFATWCDCRLPTDEEWEHAYRKGTKFRYWFEGGEDELLARAWFEKNSKGMTHPVGERPKAGKEHLNGLFDMAGNVWEWCVDWLNSDQMYKYVRGGSWDGSARTCRAAYRHWYAPRFRYRPYLGFRLCRRGPD